MYLKTGNMAGWCTTRVSPLFIVNFPHEKKYDCWVEVSELEIFSRATECVNLLWESNVRIFFFGLTVN